MSDSQAPQPGVADSRGEIRSYRGAIYVDGVTRTGKPFADGVICEVYAYDIDEAFKSIAHQVLPTYVNDCSQYRWQSVFIGPKTPETLAIAHTCLALHRLRVQEARLT